MENGRPGRIHGDKENPISHGFSCIKGRNLGEYHFSPTRLLHSQKRDGAVHRPIASQVAHAEIGRKLRETIDRYGPRSVAIYCGTFGFLNILAYNLATALMDAIESPMFFTSATIDQPGKLIAPALMGSWLAGWQRDPQKIDVALLIGQNPVVSLTGSFGMNPAKNILDAKRRGMKLFAIDPRQSETASYADIFLQPNPGRDPVILAGMIRLILEEGLYDREFVEAESNGLDLLREAVSFFTTSTVCEIADIPASEFEALVRQYASAKSGLIVCGTGTNMSGSGTLSEFLSRCIAVLCGHYPRAGEPVPNPGVLFHRPAPPMACSTGPLPHLGGQGTRLRVHDLTDTLAGMPTPVLADEILLPGEGKVRALIVLGGNPVLAFPDQEKATRAMDALDLLVCIDPQLGATARRADYVLAPTLPLEQPAVTSYNEFVGTFGMVWGYDLPYAQYTPALLPHPPGSDLLDDWQHLFAIAREADLKLTVKPATFVDPQRAAEHAVHLDMDETLSSEDMLDIMFRDAPVPIQQVREKCRAGYVFDLPEQLVLPRPEDWQGRFALAAPQMMADLATIAKRVVAGEAPDPRHRMMLISRRMRDSYNSSWHDHEPLTRQHQANPAMMHSQDLATMDLQEGDVVEIQSDHGTIWGLARIDDQVRPGCVSMSHCWGVAPDEKEAPERMGGATNRLASTDRDCERYSWMARQSAIPVSVTKATRQF